MRTFRLIRTPQASAVWNMQQDREIFNRYLKDGIPVFRVYRWQSPSFTYGVSQNPENEINLAKCLSDSVEVVKRMTGGGILFHHDEITYSFACSKRDIKEPQGLIVSYREICAFLIRFYQSLGLKSSFALEEAAFKNKSLPNKFCSASYEKYDIVINGRKIGGNAQKRSREVIFQHGSVPCSIDWDLVRSYTKSFPKDISASVTSLCEELKVNPDKDILEQKLIDAFSSVFGADFVEDKELLYETSMAE